MSRSIKEIDLSGDKNAQKNTPNLSQSHPIIKSFSLIKAFAADEDRQVKITIEICYVFKK